MSLAAWFECINLFVNTFIANILCVRKLRSSYINQVALAPSLVSFPLGFLSHPAAIVFFRRAVPPRSL